VDERGGVQRPVPSPLAAVGAGYLVELFVEDGDGVVERVVVTGGRSSQESGKLFWRYAPRAGK